MRSAQQHGGPGPAATLSAGGGCGPSALQQLSWLTWVPIGLMSTILAASVAVPVTTRSLALPLAVVGALVGLPHGAIDHLLPRWVAGLGPVNPRFAGRPIVLVAAGYGTVAGTALTSMLLLPLPTLVLFLVVSAGHFGWGEVEASARRAGRSSPTLRREWPVAAGYGALVVGAVMWLRPSQTASITGELSHSLARAALASRAVGLFLTAAAVTLGLGLLLKHAHYLEAAELTLLAITFTLAPPLAAFGVYFGGWHSIRHLGRLLDLTASRRTPGTPQDGWAPDWPAASRLLLRTGWLPTLGALAGVAALWGARDRAGLSTEVAILLALTFPHVMAVRILDRFGSRG
jgi:Brp/Blh family beta-carotene 15,15'-monooxygenase